MPALLQEIVSVYPMLSPPNLTAHVSNRVCNALALLQCVASHPETRQLFLNGTYPPLIPYSSGDDRPTPQNSAHTPLLVPVLEYDVQNTPF
jgi:Cell differentiation family, Rcd1-like